MKRILSLLIGLACMVSVNIQAQTSSTLQEKAFSTQGLLYSNSLDNVSYAVISAFSVPAGPPVITSLNATSDRLSQNVQLYLSGLGYQIGGTNGVNGNTNNWATSANDSTGTNNLQPTAFVTAFPSNTIVVLRHQLTDTYERLRVFSSSISNIVWKIAPTLNAVSGDYIYPQSTNGFISIGVATGGTAVTLSINNAGGIANGVFPGRPFLLETTGGTNQSIGAVSGFFLP